MCGLERELVSLVLLLGNHLVFYLMGLCVFTGLYIVQVKHSFVCINLALAVD